MQYSIHPFSKPLKLVLGVAGIPAGTGGEKQRSRQVKDNQPSYQNINQHYFGFTLDLLTDSRCRRAAALPFKMYQSGFSSYLWKWEINVLAWKLFVTATYNYNHSSGFISVTFQSVSSTV